MKLRRALSHMNIDKSKYSGHSFRIGAATSVAMIGVPNHMIKMMGWWESSAYTYEPLGSLWQHFQGSSCNQLVAQHN